ncbi:MAG: glycoside hydrolase family 16 protein [Thermoanaerobaculia bacterium]|nr:glycoside hydrolase family 16 protein [Thermoanaerobaculia bacterium]
MAGSLAGLLAVLGLLAPAAADAACDRIPWCELVWSDEFDGDALDLSRWQVQTGDGTAEGLPSGWGNNELQWYQAANATVADGVLTVTAREETVGGFAYTSARIRSLGRGDFTYGRFEMRARMPVGQGLWPAFWMLPSASRYGGWAASGEIDIVELLGHEPDLIHGTIHFGGEWPANTSRATDWRLAGGDFHDGFHLFAVEWEPGELRWYVDDVHYGTQSEWSSTGGPYPAPFDADFHLLLNLAVGGNWPGPPDASTRFPQELVVDYVRVYQSAAARGTQAATASLFYDRPQKLKKVRASLSTVFENQAVKRDRPRDGRLVRCAVRARGPKGRVAPQGTLRLELVGELRGAGWRGDPATVVLDADGRAELDAETLAELVEQAATGGASIERIAVAYSGSGKAKVSELDLDCWQRPAG